MMSWEKIIKRERQKPYFQDLQRFLDQEYKDNAVYPSEDNLFNCFKQTPFERVKVVIIGQDPYHQKGQSHGLAFSVLDGCKIPPSLRNIFKELQADLGVNNQGKTDLTKWANEGVLLLNKVLSVRDSSPTSHSNKGWETFTDNILIELSKRDEPIIYLLWGNNALTSKKFITNKNHYIIESSHPSPLSAYHSFNGSRPFSKINAILKSHNIDAIDWSL